MFKLLKIENFKCFLGKAEIPLSKITVCTGMNSVGKSTLIQALLLLKQSDDSFLDMKNENLETNVLLNTDALNLGSTNQIMRKDKMLLAIDSFWMEYIARDDKLSLNINRCDGDSMPKVYYLNAERLGPRNYQKMKSHELLHCGYHGEYTFDVITKNPLATVSESRCFKSSTGIKINDLDKQIEYWVSYIVNGVEVTFSSDVTTQLSQMKVRQAAFDTEFNSPYNFGFGISYVLPIIVNGLIAEPKSLVIVENPEAHLHPAGQSRIGEFLAQLATTDLQVVIETHSEHVINGIRKYALRNQMSAEDVCINYFEIKDGNHTVKRLALNERMDIMEWPEGFFDQEPKDLKEMRELREIKNDM